MSALDLTTGCSLTLDRVVCVGIALVARLLCSFIFADGELILEGQHSEMLIHLYRIIGNADGLPEVRRLDSLAVRLFIGEEHIQKHAIPEKASKVARKIEEALQSTKAPGFDVLSFSDLRYLCSRAIKLKMQLLVSPLDYHILFFPPGMPFDRGYMEAEGVDGTPLLASQCKTKHAQLCLYPAVAQFFSPPFDQGSSVTEALIMNKRFLADPARNTIANALSVVSKAIVLVE
ncbi:uncharacterized protein BDR25DRAFT_311143 [Lindgomyces ingoldianus]|uniref:Uncharacterized protein n=1 Tax=Lindgomyces ingoldianus TaxID=673940 RepID=A0ACB6R853_9PLEO|nr:uncharacterized protein BDR25DRAFT_311143 [Lindgomyces ingoldianus]KAF2474702.1 hypothetical protein BDR25DRAFT_311143 [Lindgomyces ingoldianus]